MSCYEELNDAIKKLKRESYSVFKNCYLLPDELKEKVNSGKIKYIINSDSITLLDVCPDFDSVMFFIGDKAERIETGEKKNKLIDIIYTSQKPVDERIISVLESSGFSKLNRAYRMALTDFSEIDASHTDNNITFAGENMAEDIIDLWRETFDPSEIYLENYDEVREKILKKQILVSLKSNKVVGAVTADIDERGNAILRHVAVSSNERGSGLGHSLCLEFLKKREEIGYKKMDLWVEDYRKPAIGLYEKLGFIRTGKEMLRYAKKI